MARGRLIELPGTRRWWRWARRVLTIFTSISRETQKRGFRAHISVARATGCRWSSTPARPTTIPAASWRRKWRGGLSSADPLLHRRARIRPEGARSRAVDFVLRHLTSRTPKPCGKSPRKSRRTASLSKPTRRTWRPASFAANATNRPSWSRSHSACGDARRLAGGDFAPDDGKLLPAIFKGAGAEGRRMTMTLTILGCGSSAGVPRPALGWGACDPTNPKTAAAAVR